MTDRTAAGADADRPPSQGTQLGRVVPFRRAAAPRDELRALAQEHGLTTSQLIALALAVFGIRVPIEVLDEVQRSGGDE